MQKHSKFSLMLMQKGRNYLLLTAVFILICLITITVFKDFIFDNKANLITYLIMMGIILLLLLMMLSFQKGNFYQSSANLSRVNRLREIQYEHIINNVASVIFTTDLSGKFTFVSKRSVQLTGFAADELLGKHFTTILDPQWMERVVENYYSQFLHQLDETIYEFPIINKNGYKKWVEQIAVLIKEKGKPVGFHCIVRDISDKKQIQLDLEAAENNFKQQQFQLQSVLDNTTSIIFSKDLNGKYTLANQRFMDLLQVNKSQVIGYTDYHFSSKEQADYFASLDEKIISERKPIEVEQIIQGPNGPVNLLLVKFPLFDQNKNVFGVSGIATDISERTQYQKELIFARQAAENAKLLQEQFLANMSHEIRTPMNGIQGMTNLLLESSLNPEQENYANIIKRSVNNLLVIINDILDFSKIQAGKLNIETIAFDLKESVESIRPMFSHRLEKKNLELELVMNERVPQFLIGDPYRLNQILVNLVGNAIKFTEKGKITLSVSVKNRTHQNGTLQFSVRDTGIGIEHDKLNYVFESFSQAGSDVTRKYGGTGLGLTISKQLIELQHGSIGVKSEIGVGTDFYFELPYVFADEKDVIGIQRLTEIDFTKVLKGKKVMVAEDNSVNQILINHVLTNVGIQPTIVNDGMEAIELLENGFECDLLLMDLQMPKMDGYKTTTTIRTELLIETPIIAMTATAMKGEYEKCLEVGFTDYMSKPFEFIDLYKKICKVLKIQMEEKLDPSLITSNDELPKNEEIKPYSLSQFLQNLQKKDLIDLLKPLYDSLNNDIHVIVDSIKIADGTTAARVAHKLKGSVAYIKAKDLHSLLQKIETNALQVEKCRQLNQDLDLLVMLANEIKTYLAVEIKELSNELAIAC